MVKPRKRLMLEHHREVKWPKRLRIYAATSVMTMHRSPFKPKRLPKDEIGQWRGLFPLLSRRREASPMEDAEYLRMMARRALSLAVETTDNPALVDSLVVMAGRYLEIPNPKR
jgi:hypothetical protein